MPVGTKSCSTGREELAAAMDVSRMTTGSELRVLDVGCGVGRVSFALAEHFGQVVGVEISESLLQVARLHDQSPRLQFELIEDFCLEPDTRPAYDTIFANEVFYYLDQQTLTNYSEDPYRLLRAGREYVFELNMEPIPRKTRLSWWLRNCLYQCGLKKCRGWSTSPGFTRRHHSENHVRNMLESIGFLVERVNVRRSIRQTWFVARKPIE